MGESLNPTLLTRINQALRPDWIRTVRARRITAAALVVLAGAAAIRSDPRGEQVDVVVASRDIAPGTALTVDDVSLQSRPARLAPDGAASDLSSVLRTTLAGPARRGEAITDVRVLGSRLTDATTGPDARIVGVHPSDAALIDLVRPGDVVDIVTAGGVTSGGDESAGTPVVLASGGIVVLVSDKHNRDDRVVLVALPATAAIAVAGVALTQAVTLTLR